MAAQTTLKDSQIKICKAGWLDLCADNKASATEWGTSYAAVDYGGSTDTWGGLPTVAQIKTTGASGFGAFIKATQVTGGTTQGNKKANVDAATITIYWHLPKRSSIIKMGGE